MTSLNPIERGIIASLAYFDLLDYPLKAAEVARWFYTKSPIEGLTRAQVLDTLQNSASLKSFIEQKDGHYTLIGRGELVSLRREKSRFAQPKWKIAKRAAGWLRWVPFIRLVAVCNKLAYDNVRPESDIDFFIVSHSKRLWITRFAATVMLDLLGLRRRGPSIKDKVCLSFFVTDDALDLEPLSLKPDDPHFRFWIDQFVLLFGQPELVRFQQANSWIKQRLPFAFTETKARIIGDAAVIRIIRQFKEWFLNGWFGDRFEALFKRFQLAKMQLNRNSRAWSDNTDVVISDQVLKFHEADRRAEYREKFINRMTKINDNDNTNPARVRKPTL